MRIETALSVSVLDGDRVVDRATRRIAVDVAAGDAAEAASLLGRLSVAETPSMPGGSADLAMALQSIATAAIAAPTPILGEQPVEQPVEQRAPIAHGCSVSMLALLAVVVVGIVVVAIREGSGAILGSASIAGLLLIGVVGACSVWLAELGDGMGVVER
ncbi:MAG TPA: hypothetical protein PKC43_06155 [Phycisphaerales bacterium]|nr:hypothetical protein [Phycisphaerales bacterium]HMP37015.1 hypothetical protein [Phycisphaerales bacterium]